MILRALRGVKGAGREVEQAQNWDRGNVLQQLFLGIRAKRTKKLHSPSVSKAELATAPPSVTGKAQHRQPLGREGEQVLHVQSPEKGEGKPSQGRDSNCVTAGEGKLPFCKTTPRLSGVVALEELGQHRE